MIVYKIEYSPEAVRDLDDVFADVLTASKDIEITHKYLEELQDRIDSMVKRPETGTPLYYPLPAGLESVPATPDDADAAFFRRTLEEQLIEVPDDNIRRLPDGSFYLADVTHMYTGAEA